MTNTIDETTHEILEEEIDGYDPATAETSAEEWVEDAPAPEPAQKIRLQRAPNGDWYFEITSREGVTVAEVPVADREPSARAKRQRPRRTKPVR